MASKINQADGNNRAEFKAATPKVAASHLVSSLLFAVMFASSFFNAGVVKAQSAERRESTRNAGSAPVITTEPVSQKVNAGQTATFTVADTGTAPLTYQWMRDGVAISGATSSSYTTPAATSSDDKARFKVTVKNGAGKVTSSVATLTVDAGTMILSSSASNLSFGSVNVSSSSNQTVTLTNAGTATVTISNVSLSGAGFNVSGVSAGAVLNPGQSATLTATFAPAAAGSSTGSITVSSNATNGAQMIALSGTGLAQATHSVNLAWTPSTSSVIGYNVYVSTTSGSGYSKLTGNPVATPDYSDGGLQQAQTRYYVVTSVNSNNVESGYSNEVSALIP